VLYYENQTELGDDVELAGLYSALDEEKLLALSKTDEKSLKEDLIYDKIILYYRWYACQPKLA
jgi:hypothetical protein